MSASPLKASSQGVDGQSSLLSSRTAADAGSVVTLTTSDFASLTDDEEDAADGGGATLSEGAGETALVVADGSEDSGWAALMCSGAVHLKASIPRPPPTTAATTTPRRTISFDFGFGCWMACPSSLAASARIIPMAVCDALATAMGVG